MGKGLAEPSYSYHLTNEAPSLFIDFQRPWNTEINHWNSKKKVAAMSLMNIREDTRDMSSDARLSTIMIFMRLKPGSHSAVLQGIN